MPGGEIGTSLASTESVDMARDSVESVAHPTSAHHEKPGRVSRDSSPMATLEEALARQGTPDARKSDEVILSLHVSGGLDSGAPTASHKRAHPERLVRGADNSNAQERFLRRKTNDVALPPTEAQARAAEAQGISSLWTASANPAQGVSDAVVQHASREAIPPKKRVSFDLSEQLPATASPSGSVLAKSARVAEPKIGPRLCVGSMVKGELGSSPLVGFSDVRIDRASIFGNAFPMGAKGRDESLRERVCDACKQRMEAPLTANLIAIAHAHGLHTIFEGAKVASSGVSLNAAIESLCQRLKSGESIRLLCWCKPLRCHGDDLATVLAKRVGGGLVQVIDHPVGTASEEHPTSANAAMTVAAPIDLSEVDASHHISIGASSKPHAAPHEQSAFQRVERAAHSGSLRTLEPELQEVLAVEPLPMCNVPKVTEPIDPPVKRANAPTPKTTEELIPEKVFSAVVSHGRLVQSVLRRARRGKDGWKQARSARPEALIFEEHEALNECGWGWVWRKRPAINLWDPVQPSIWPEDPPETSINVEAFMKLASDESLTDNEFVSWAQHGLPGAVNMPSRAVIGYPHLGALKHSDDFEAMNARDIANKFVSHGEAFPQFWPCICDPMNLVMQNEKPRATIDKTINLSSRAHPEKVLAYNDYIDLETERATVGGLSLPTTSVFCRGAAILLSCGLRVKGGKFDLTTYYRMWGKQRAHVHQSYRVMETLFGVDWRVNFGERDAPFHCCRGSDALAYFIRCELRRLDAEYPCKVPGVVTWLAIRLGLARDADEADDPYFRWAVLFFIIYYIDDAGLACICDGPLIDRKGQPKIETHVRSDGSVVKVHLERPEFYYFVSMEIATRIGHGTPDKKQDPMSYRFELLGVITDLDVQRMLLSRLKRDSYSTLLNVVRKGEQRLTDGLVASKYDDTNSLAHKLNFAAAVVPGGRQHLFHLRKAIYSTNRLSWRAVVISGKADKELEWWDAQLLKSESLGSPLASRWSFPASSDRNIVRYSDASRELGDLIASGFGAWAVVRGVFVYIVGRWTQEEMSLYSINVLEAKAAVMGGVVIIEYAKSVGCAVTHTMAYVDNSTAEHVAERGRATTEGIHDINLSRQAWLQAESVYETTERVASVDNDVADLLSRGDVVEALRFPLSAGLRVLELPVGSERRSLSGVSPTWPADASRVAPSL